jgi:hypothetical protein
MLVLQFCRGDEATDESDRTPAKLTPATGFRLTIRAKKQAGLATGLLKKKYEKLCWN